MVLTIRRSVGPVNQPVSAFLLLINDDHFYQHPCLLRVFGKGHAWLISRVGAQRFDFHAAPIRNVRHPGFLLGGAMWEKQLQSGFHLLQGLKIMFATGPCSPCAILWFPSILEIQDTSCELIQPIEQERLLHSLLGHNVCSLRCFGVFSWWNGQHRQGSGLSWKSPSHRDWLEDLGMHTDW